MEVTSDTAEQGFREVLSGKPIAERSRSVDQPAAYEALDGKVHLRMTDSDIWARCSPADGSRNPLRAEG